MKKSIKLLTALALATLSTIHTARAGSHTWTGQGITKNWSLPANWVGDYPPAVGEADSAIPSAADVAGIIKPPAGESVARGEAGSREPATAATADSDAPKQKHG